MQAGSAHRQVSISYEAWALRIIQPYVDLPDSNRNASRSRYAPWLDVWVTLQGPLGSPAGAAGRLGGVLGRTVVPNRLGVAVTSITASIVTEW